MTTRKIIVLCADDFGLNPDVSHGILKLVRAHRLSAVGCMTNRPDFNAQAKELRALKNEVQLGLHFNLTEGPFLSDSAKQGFNLNELLIKSHLRWIKPALIAKELNCQLDCFVDWMGKMPDFIDGHQHVHQFPGIRQTLLTVYEQRLKSHGTAIRATYPALTLARYQFKGYILALAGGKKLYKSLKNNKIPHNPCFSGVYDFRQEVPYRTLFRQWLALVPTNTLIMCHPGEASLLLDPIAPARSTELSYFLSDDFLYDCEAYQVDLMLTTSPAS